MAFILSQIIQKKVPEWNKQILTEADIFALAEKMNVLILENEIAKSKGEYLIIANKPLILLKANLNLTERIWILFHEFGHHLLHYPVAHKFSKGLVRRMDREANFFAAIALMPSWLIQSKTLHEIIDEYNYSKDLINIRKEIYEAYRI